MGEEGTVVVMDESHDDDLGPLATVLRRHIQEYYKREFGVVGVVDGDDNRDCKGVLSSETQQEAASTDVG